MHWPLTIEKGTLGVNTPAESRGSRTPIDGFVNSLAAVDMRKGFDGLYGLVATGSVKTR